MADSDHSPRPLEGVRQGLLVSLSEVAARVQRGRTVDAVFDIAAAGLRELGLKLTVLKLEGDRLVIHHVLEEDRPALEAGLGRALRGFGAPASTEGPARRALASGRAVYVPDLEGWAHVYLGESTLERERIARALADGYASGVIAPVDAWGRRWGLLAVTSSALREEDAPALALFAAQFGSAIEVASSLESLERRSRELGAVQAMATAASAAEPDALVPSLLRLFAEATASECGVLYLIEPGERELVIAGAHGPNLERLVSRFGRLPLDADVPSASAIRSVWPFASNVRDWPGGAGEELAAAGLVECATVPFCVDARISGTLHFGRTTARPYTADELRFAQVLAAQLATQLERARLDAEARKRLRQLSLLLSLTRIVTQTRDVETLVDRALAQLSETLPAQVALVHLLVEGKLVLSGARLEGGARPSPTLVRVSMEPSSLVGRAASLLRTVGLEEAELVAERRRFAEELGVRHAIGAPLLSDGWLRGTLTVGRTTEPGFTQEDQQLLEACAGQIAAAVEHARLFEEERRRVHDLSLINELGGLIAQHLELPAVLSAGVRHLSRLADVPHVFLLLLDQGREQLSLAASNLEHPGEVVIAMGESSAATAAIRSGQPLVIDHSMQDPRASRHLVQKFGHRSIVAVPLIAEGRPIGALILGETREGRRFSKGEVDRAVAVSNQLATAISNAQLYEDLKRSYEQLERAQAELVRHERLAALGELAAVMAHEVRNPLGVIFNSLGSLKKLLEPKGDAELLLRIVGEEADRLNRIVGELLDFSRPFEAQLKPIDVGALVEGAIEAASAVGSSPNVRIAAEVRGEIGAPSGDAHLLRQALVNLITNAIQAMPRGGTVAVRAEQETGSGRSQVRIEVVDQGVGISPENVERIFQPFFTTKATGTGLGLAVVKRIVDAHQGELEVQSAPGAGTTFVVRLPL